MNLRSRYTRALWLCMAALLLAACNESSERDIAPDSLPGFARTRITISHGQRSHAFDVWLADTPARRERGLMFVNELPRGQGMLFVFDQPQTVGMWMKNTLIPLDMLFIAADGRIVNIAANTQPHSLASIESSAAALGVLEIGGGESARLGIVPGDVLRHEAFTPH